jgi:predicted Zn finger-like uncharacterized protein
MSLATRCGHCGTIFRVVQDQLKVSEGWVRCGRCGDVFNALQALFDLEREPPPPFPGQPRDDGRPPVPTRHTPLTPAEPGGGGPPVSASSGTVGGPGDGGSGASVDGKSTSAAASFVHDPDLPAEPPGRGGDPAPPSSVADDGLAPRGGAIESRGATSFDGAARGSLTDTDPDLATTGPGPAWRDDPANEPGPSRLDTADTRAEPGFDPTRQDEALTRVDDPIDADRFARAEAAAAEVIPEFLREDRARSVGSPLARALWAFSAVALALALAVQVAVQRRDTVAQTWPWTRPLLAQWCAVSGCELLDAPRRIQAFSVETSSLTRQSPTGEVYRFSVTLRNRSAQPALMPSIDLSLDDANGQLLARRALGPADFRVSRPVVAGGADATLQLVMTAAQGQASGYRIELFYP